ncbi:MAG: polysaccharide deacetylase family protein [Candidatus Eiseniibacteriota bacterium]
MKQLLAALCYRSGLLGLWWSRRRRPLIVMYHRVLDPAQGNDVSQAGIVVSTPTFERQLLFLARHFDMLPLVEVLPGAGSEGSAPAPPGQRTGTRGRPPCAVTFDDGWADTLEQALPVLRRHAVPATIFIATGYIGTRELFWPERLIHALRGAGRTRVRPERLDGVSQESVVAVMQAVAATDDDLDAALDRLIEHLKTTGEDEREALIEAVATVTGRPASGLEPRMLDWRGVETLRAAGIEIGSHGVSHTILTRVDHGRAVQEIEASRRQLAGPAGELPGSFAYPNGDWNPALADAVRQAGYARAVAAEPPRDGTWPGLAGTVTQTSQFAAIRKNLSEGSSRGVRGFSTSVLACEVMGFFDALRRRGGRR